MDEERQTVTCPRCGHTSAFPEDVRWGWCSRCQDYTRGERVQPARP